MACHSCGYNPCNCNNTVHSFNWNTVPDQSCDPCDTTFICKYTFPGRCVIYNGPNLTCFGLGTNVNYDVIIASIHSIICTLLGTETCVAPSALSIIEND